ncbi:hypothetical protein V3C99_008439 [Haemonchus contortus]|uniref:Phlebovirus_G2 domain-containing protein n=1 Tax=Haemonchus contortus TaxID=6289 RepID=A0A7I4YMZ5_HAECO
MSTINTPKQTFTYDYHQINRKKTFAWWTLTLSSLGVPPTPVLDSTFIWDDTETAVVPRLYRPPLICRTPEEARNMTCEIEEDCKCTPAEYMLKFHGDKCYESDDVLEDDELQFVNLEADKDTVINRRGGSAPLLHEVVAATQGARAP